MGLDFDANDFLHNLRATKPPYECPYPDCQKTYKSYQGISFHLCNHHPYNRSSSASTVGGNKKKSTSTSSRAASKSPLEPDNGSSSVAIREAALTYAEAQRMIEVEIEGRLHRININEPMNIVVYDSKKNGLKDLPPLDEGINLNDSTSGQLNVSVSCDESIRKDENKSSSELNAKGKNTSIDGTNDGTSTPGSKRGKNKSGKSGKKGGHSKNKSSSAASSKCGDKNHNQDHEEKAPKLPEPSFRVIDDYNLPDAPERPASYFRFIEKSTEELDESVEYDMDEEDCAWLDLINKKRKAAGQQAVPPDDFELLMDRLEKESYFMSQNSGNEVTPAIDEDAVCVICNDGDCQNSNAILFCDMCDLAVHQECYGVPYIPEGQWLCRRCLHSPSAGVDCVLCPNKGGAFKQTDTGTWAHVVCALWIPEVCFANTVFLEPIDSIDNIPTARWKLNCYICKTKGVGACIQCHKPNCYVAFHVTCAQQAGLFMKIEAIRELASGPVIRKAAYCHSHTPVNENGTSLSGVYNSGDDDSRSSFGATSSKKSDKKNSRKSVTATSLNNDAEFKEKIRKTRKILQEKRSATPNVSIPTIPSDRLTAIAEKITFPKRNQFIQRLIGYWTLKRQSRNGVPLLRRLQISYNGSRRGDGSVNGGSGSGQGVDGVTDEAIKKIKEEAKYWQRLRQDLEKARLLIELIRKREKMKASLIEISQQTMELHLQPFKRFLLNVHSMLESKDTSKFFLEPVDPNEVHDYLEFIKDPMDFQTMKQKILDLEYSSLKEMETDFDLIVNNCCSYNDPDTIYYKAAVKLREACKGVWKDAKDKLVEIGFHELFGLLNPLVEGITNSRLPILSPPPSPKRSPSPMRSPSTRLASPGARLASPEEKSPSRPSSAKKKKAVVEVAGDSEDVLNERMSTLKNELSQVYLRKSGGSKSKKIRELKAKILSVNQALHDIDPVNYELIDEASLSPSKKYRRRTASQDSHLSSVQDDEFQVKDENGNEDDEETPIKKKKTPSKKRCAPSTPSTPTVSRTPKKTPAKKRKASPVKSDNSSTDDEDGDKDDDDNDGDNTDDGELTDIYTTPIKPPPSSSASAAASGGSSKKNPPASKRKISPSKSDKSSPPTKKVRKPFSISPSKFDSGMSTLDIVPSTSRPVGESPVKKKNSSNANRNKKQSSSLSVPQTDSFKVYRSQDHSSSDSESRKSNNSLTSRSNLVSSSASPGQGSDKDEDNDEEEEFEDAREELPEKSNDGNLPTNVINSLPLLAEDLVWAKSSSSESWFPGMIVRVKGNRSRIKKTLPIPPIEIMRKGRREKKKGNDYLVNLFDEKSSWFWMARSSLEPLGVEDEIDSNKIKSIKKTKDRKVAREAYERAIVQRIENSDPDTFDNLISEDEDDKDDAEEDVDEDEGEDSEDDGDKEDGSGNSGSSESEDEDNESSSSASGDEASEDSD